MTPLHNEPTRKAWKKFLLRYFDLNDNGKISWWEASLPIVILIIIETLANVLANLITN